ncbi:MAG: peptidylprolyl isomerase [Clostridium sp.]|nr:peptidylprolyl isomerase [Clostridium sp.]
MKTKKKIIMLSISILIPALVYLLFLFFGRGESHLREKPFGFESLKINGSYVSSDIMLEERNRFFRKWGRNAEVLFMDEEERNNMFLDEVIERILLEDYIFSRSGKGADEEEVEHYVERFIEPRYSDSGGIRAYMDSRGHSDEDDMEREIIEYIIKQKSMYEVAKEAGISLTEEELDEGYQKHVIQNKKADIKHILISTAAREENEAQDLAWKIYERLQDGENFETLAKSYSDDQDTRENGGNITGLRSGFRGAAFDNAVFALGADGLLEPIEVVNGYEIVYIEKQTEFCRTKDEYKIILTVDKFVQSDEYKKWFDELKQDYDIEISYDNL